jgi:hypothetical protein
MRQFLNIQQKQQKRIEYFDYERRRRISSVLLVPRINFAATTISSIMITIQLLLFVVVVVTLYTKIPAVHAAQYAYLPGGYQTNAEQNPNGYSWASAAVYNAGDNSLIITGTTYGVVLDDDNILNPSAQSSGRSSSSSVVNNGTCFLVYVAMPTPTPNDTDASNDVMSFIQSQLLTDYDMPSGSQRNREFCSYISRHDTMLYVTGTSVNDGHSTLEPLISKGQVIRRKNVGIFMEQDGALAKDSGILPVKGGHVLEDDSTTFPQAVYYPPGESIAYIASLVSSQATLADINPSVDPFDAVRINSAHSRWSSAIQKIERKTSGINEFAFDVQLQETYKSGWMAPIVSAELESVYVTGVTVVGTNVVAVGYTNGTGAIVGAANSEMFGNDLDGFVTKLNIQDGQFEGSGGQNTASARINSPNNRDDVISGLCTETKLSPEYMYIVGSTKGYVLPAQPSGSVTDENSIQAFLSKLDTQTLEVMWTVQLEADTTSGANAVVRGLNCAVSPDGANVWIGGNVENSNLVSTVTNVKKSFGGTDIFVANVAAVEGTVTFALQIGSSGDDFMAIQKGLLTDSAGNAIVVGTTTGSLFRTRSESEAPNSSNVFVMTIDKTNGSYTTLSNDDGNNGVAPPISSPVEAPTTANDSPVPAPTPDTPTNKDGDTPDGDFDEGSNSVSTPQKPPASTSIKESNNGHSQRWNMLVATLCILLFVVVAAVSYTNHRLAYREISTDRGKVLSYMGAFEVEDIDLKHSATGGWHCSYTGDLAQGKNRREYYTEDLNIGNGGLYRYSGSSSLLGASSNGLGLGLVDGEFDPLDPNGGSNGGGVQRLIDRTTAEYGGFEDATVRSGRTALSIRGDSLFSDSDDDAATISSSRRSASQSNDIHGNNYDDGFETLTNNYDTTLGQQQHDNGLPQRQSVSDSNPSSLDSSFSFFNSSNKSGTWGKDIV